MTIQAIIEVSTIEMKRKIAVELLNQASKMIKLDLIEESQKLMNIAESIIDKL